MNESKRYGRYDQGFFNTACKLVEEIAPRNHLHFLCELDASGMDQIRLQQRRAGGSASTYTAFVVKATGLALREHPHLNCMIRETPFGVRLMPLDNMTATVAVERMCKGVDMVFAPMLENADRRDLDELTDALRGFAQDEVNQMPAFRQFLTLVKWARWMPTVVGWLFRLPALSPGLWKKYRGGSYAVTSPGKYGGCDQVLPPWPWPITISFGNIKPRPWVERGELVVRRTMRLTITVDRRLANGAPLARFAEDLKGLLENPERFVSTRSKSNEKVLETQNVQATPQLNTIG